jgi:hypothetical protein
MTRPSPKLDIQYVVHWILFVALIMAAVGIGLQFYRYGGVMESGSIGPAGP